MHAGMHYTKRALKHVGSLLSNLSRKIKGILEFKNSKIALKNVVNVEK